MSLRLHGTRRLTMTAVAALSVLIADVVAQDAKQAPPAAGPTFDVVSIKPNTSNSGSACGRRREAATRS